MKQKKILIVGQTPPPYYGQAMMIQKTVEAPFTKVKVYHIRMAFSKNIEQVSRFGFSKIAHLFSLIFKTIYYRFRYNISSLYYIPVGHSLTPLLRDIVYLLPIRLFFSNTIFHFRAGGVYDYVVSRKQPLKNFSLLAYKKPSLAIHLTGRNSEYTSLLGKTRQAVIPNGAKDCALDTNYSFERKGNAILFVGILREDKGLTDLISACAILHSKNIDFTVNVLGEFDSPKYRNKIMRMIEDCKIKDRIHFHGIALNDAKFSMYAKSDIFCFPSFFIAEALPNVLIEAMMFSLPIISTYHAGIPDLVLDKETGFLVPIKTPEKVAEKLELLISDKELTERMGRKGRERYLHQYTIEKYYERMETSLASI